MFDITVHIAMRSVPFAGKIDRPKPTTVLYQRSGSVSHFKSFEPIFHRMSIIDADLHLKRMRERERERVERYVLPRT